MGECDELLLVSDTDDVCGPAISSDPPDQLYLAEFLDPPRSVRNRFLEGSLMLEHVSYYTSANATIWPLSKSSVDLPNNCGFGWILF